jgi:hypothetical protein
MFALRTQYKNDRMHSVLLPTIIATDSQELSKKIFIKTALAVFFLSIQSIIK